MTPEMKQIIAELVKVWHYPDRVISLHDKWPELAKAIQALVDEYEKEQ